MKPIIISKKQFNAGVRIRHGSTDLLIVPDMGSPDGVLICAKGRPIGNEPRPLQLVVSPRSTLTLAVEAK